MRSFPALRDLGLALVLVAGLSACTSGDDSSSAGAGEDGSAAGNGGGAVSGSGGAGNAGENVGASGGSASGGSAGSKGSDSGAGGSSAASGSSGDSGEGGSGGSSGSAGGTGGAGDGASGGDSGSGASGGGSGGSDGRVCEGDRWVNTDDDFTALVAERCGVITGTLNIAGTKTMTSLRGLEALTEISTHLRVYLNQALTSLEGLEEVTAVGGELELADNEVLAQVGLPQLSTVGSLSIKGNPALASLEGLQALAAIRGEVGIRLNPSLASLAGLSALETVQAQLQISDNESLTELRLERLAVTGGLSITWNPLLVSLGDMRALRTIEADLVVSANEALASLEGIASLEKVGGSLELSDNDALTTLDLASLADVGSDISVVDNDVLPQAAACKIPAELEAVNGEVIIRDNLGDGSDCAPCSASESRCRGIVQEICDSGVFLAAATCPSACAFGECVQGPECNYGDQRCQGAGIEHCGTEGTWLLETCYRDACADDACAYPRCGHLGSCCALLEDTDKTECETVSANATNDECDARLRAFHEVGLCLCSSPNEQLPPLIAGGVPCG